MNKRHLPASMIIFVIMVFLVSCGGPEKAVIPSGNSDAGDRQTVLKFISSWGGVDSKAETLKNVLDAFQKSNPNIVVHNESLFGEDFLPKIKTDFASGNDPDVFGMWPGSDINALIKAGKVAFLDDILNEDRAWRDSFNPDTWAYTTYDGKIYGLPFEVIFECLFVNTDLFYEYKIKIPQTFEELLNAVEAFKKHNIIPIAYNSQAEGTFLYQNIAAMLGGKEDIEEPFEAGKVKPCYIEAMKYVKELYDRGAFPKECLTISNNERNTLFKQKKAAMIIQGSWFIGDFPAYDQTVDIEAMPFIPGGKAPENSMVNGLGGGSFHLASSAGVEKTKLAASLKLLKTLTSEKTAATFASETGMIGTINIDKYSTGYRRMTAKGLRMLSDAEMLIGPPDSFVERSSWETDIAGRFPYYLTGAVSAEKVWEDAIKNGIIP